MILDQIRRLRHGPLAALDRIWLPLGRFYRRIARNFPALSVAQKIGPYGPYRLSSEFTFSNLGHWGGAHNKGFTTCIEACRGKKCVFDVGAHVGFVALPVASVMSKDGHLIAFEPAVANIAMLRRHLALNGFGSVEVVEALVGESDRDGVPFFESVGPHGQNSIVLKSGNALKSEMGGYAQVMRRQVSLDSFCAKTRLIPEVIKIDVEGAELAVLRGARETLLRNRPLVILSIHPRELSLAGESVDCLRDEISNLNYDLLDIDGRQPKELKLDEYIMTPRAAKSASHPTSAGRAVRHS
jgi:FkbM family methyltransferase